jgi:tripartite-type tricarboxylate transporter receptor subunit TctC
VPVPAGTATDLTARLFAERLSVLWQQPVLVDPKPGGDGLVGLGAFAALRDPNALLFAFSTAVSLNPQVYKSLPYDPVADLLPIATTTEVIFGLAVTAASPVQTVQDLVAAARASPGKLNWAAAPGLPRFVFERFRQENSLEMVYVGYRQTSAAVTDLGENRVNVLIASVQTLQPVIDAGKARLVAICSADRAAQMPAIASAPEAGFPLLVVPGIGCAYGGRGMSPSVRDRIARDIDTVARDKQLVAQFARIGQAVRRSTATELATLLAQQAASLAPLAAVMAAAQ